MELIRDVSPERAGYTCLLGRLREFHGNVGMTMAVVDVSGSFLSNLERVKENLRELRAQGTVLSDDIIWFSDTAIRTDGCLDALDEDTLGQPPNLAGGGTLFEPVLELLKPLCQDVSSTVSLRIYTDAGFSDVPMDDALERLQRHGDIEIVDFRS